MNKSVTLEIQGIISRVFRRLNKIKLHIQLRRQRNMPTSNIERITIPIVVNRQLPVTEFKIHIFGAEVDHNEIDWQRDYVSGYTYKRQKTENIKFNKLYNRGIDIIFPWELSRFYFAISLASAYIKTEDKKHYELFKKLTLDWIKKNPYIYGVNWVSGMDVAIRASNWIIACNLFGQIFFTDKEYCTEISKSLHLHNHFIKKVIGQSTKNNHLVSMYCGLIILALSFRKEADGENAIHKSITGLEMCMKSQVNEDGTDFEHSITYHQLVLELFGSTTLLAINNGIGFSKAYLDRLFRMFKFTSCYMDSNGNAPQIGDNDSGRFIIWNKSPDLDHRYLLHLGEAIFDLKFSHNLNPDLLDINFSNKRKILLTQDQLTELNPTPSIAFNEGGYYIIQNNNFHLVVFCSEGEAGHRHFDLGSFTLSYKGEPIIVDPGSYVYTCDLAKRCHFRDYQSHNLYNEKGYKNSTNSYFGIKIDRSCRVIYFSSVELILETTLSQHTKIKRQFILTDNALHINDSIVSDLEVESYLHFSNHPFEEDRDGNFIIRPDLKLIISSDSEDPLTIGSYEYSPAYRICTSCPLITISTQRTSNTIFVITQ